ncbi:MAG: hypothetical protein K2G70_04650, partial [Turicibacter sp.]|nr:hypothetical protein [Turicibacter sp.]
MKKKFFILCTLFMLLFMAYQIFFNIKYSNQQNVIDDFKAKYILSQHAYKSSLLVSTDIEGNVEGYEELPVETGIEHSFLKQLGNKVYFDGYIAKTPSIYDYGMKVVTTLPKLGKIYEVMNPFSQYLFLTLNGGVTNEGLYNSGACYLNNQWICKEFEQDLVIRNGVIFNDKIFLYANTAYPELDGDNHLLIDEQILVYDHLFNPISTYNVYDYLGMANSTIEFYQYDNKLFLFGTDIETGEFTIIEVEDNLSIKGKVSYPET